MKLSTGKEVYANGDIFGLTKDLGLTEGYDTRYFDDEDEGREDGKAFLTPAEKCEIAAYMISRWQLYLAKWWLR